MPPLPSTRLSVAVHLALTSRYIVEAVEFRVVTESMHYHSFQRSMAPRFLAQMWPRSVAQHERYIEAFQPYLARARSSS